MKPLRVLLLGLASILAFGPPRAAGAEDKLPATPRTPVTDTYFGTAVTDYYRWIENLDNPEVQKWLKGQADYTAKTLGRIPGRDSLVADFLRLDAMRPANITSVTRKSGRYFYKKTLPTEKVGKLYYRDGIDGQETLLFDPTEGAGSKSVSLNFYQVTEDGKKVALGVSEGGSESATVRIMDVDKRTLWPESIAPCWLGVEWTQDGAGFTYNLMNSNDVHDQNRELNTRTLYHAVGADPKQDVVVFSAAKYPALGMTAHDIPRVFFTDDYRYLLGGVLTVRNELTVFYAPAAELLKPTIDWKPLLKPVDEVTSFQIHDDTLYLLSHKDAPRYRVLATSLTAPDVEHAVEVMAQGPNTISRLQRTRDHLLAITTDGVNDHLFRYGFDDRKWTEVTLPGKGTVFAGGYDATSDDASAVLTSWNQPVQRYEFDSAKGELTLSPLNVPASYPGTDDIVVEEVEAPSADGTMIPLSIVYNKAVPRDGSANCLLTGYGAYGISEVPHFSILYLGLINRGVVVAVAHVRGGGEKGYDWYHAGYKATKPNTWKDFIACGEYLVKNHYTSPAKLFGEGTSAGGILIGRAITERPDLFGAAICNVPCANALRMENSPNGPVNTPEFGTVKDSVEFRELLEMDAFQHVKRGVNYPAVICVGGFNDPRVIVWQPAKFAAALQYATGSGKPVMLQVNYDDGHFTEDKQVTFRNFANMFAFCLWQTGNPGFQPPRN